MYSHDPHKVSIYIEALLSLLFPLNHTGLVCSLPPYITTPASYQSHNNPSSPSSPSSPNSSNPSSCTYSNEVKRDILTNSNEPGDPNNSSSPSSLSNPGMFTCSMVRERETEREKKKGGVRTTYRTHNDNRLDSNPSNPNNPNNPRSDSDNDFYKSNSSHSPSNPYKPWPCDCIDNKSVVSGVRRGYGDARGDVTDGEEDTCDTHEKFLTLLQSPIPYIIGIYIASLSFSFSLFFSLFL